ncbi:hypothetical protein LMG31841_00899 [Paraburkholderia saeva]|uniref:Uncharacterized protein n=1 Tax=Paraburkholderia saeva TaxID=2777537 RepID=A0A9N8X037_9BURK|nr:hypothetical protein LMG31841_00899 [Paraburkholderia saeva]
MPVLFYRRDRYGWRVVWPLSALLTVQHADQWHDYSMTVESTPEAWAAVVRERENVTTEVANA